MLDYFFYYWPIFAMFGAKSPSTYPWNLARLRDYGSTSLPTAALSVPLAFLIACSVSLRFAWTERAC